MSDSTTIFSPNGLDHQPSIASTTEKIVQPSTGKPVYRKRAELHYNDEEARFIQDESLKFNARIAVIEKASGDDSFYYRPEEQARRDAFIADLHVRVNEMRDRRLSTGRRHTTPAPMQPPNGGISGYAAPANDDDVEPPQDEPPHADLARKRFRTRQEDKTAPPPRWLIADLIQTNSDAAIYAPKSFLKSFAAIDIANAVATGCKAFGALPVAETGPVIYYAGEGHDDLTKNRAPAWEIAHNFEPYSVDTIIYANGAPYVNRPEILEQDYAELDDWLAGRRAKLIVIDTLNRALNGEDEDRAHTASKYLNMLKGMRDRLGGATLTVAHMGKDTSRGGRGSSAFEMGFDTVLRVIIHHHDLDSDEHVICIEVAYQKIGADGARYWLKSRMIKTDDGLSLVLDPCTEHEAAAVLAAKQTGKITPDIVQDTITELTRDGGGHLNTSAMATFIAKRMDKKKDSVHRTLNRKRKKEFAEFCVGDDGWALPPGQLVRTVQDSPENVFPTN